jgi:D-amino-acid dehydrogenase
MKHIVVVGGGIIGQFSAYFLSQQGYRVTVIDKPDNGMTPASEGNCGLITPSHIYPLNSWGNIFNGLWWLGKKDAPLFIKPQINRQFIDWMLRFVWNSNQSSINKAIVARHALLQLSWKMYEQFHLQNPELNEWRSDGLLYACTTQRGLKSVQEEMALHPGLNMKSRELSKAELEALEPSLHKNLVGGALFEMDGMLKPDALLKHLHNLNEKANVKYVTDDIIRIELANNQIKSVRSNEEEYTGDEFVLATGAVAPLLLKTIGIHLPVIPGKGYNLTINRPLENQPHYPIYMTERKVVATPWKTGFRLGSTMEFSGYDLSLNDARLNALKRAATEYLDISLDEIEFKPWAGWRPMKSDGIPVIERNKKYSNLILATAHSMLGLSMAPATGILVSELISGNPSSLDLGMYRLD